MTGSPETFALKVEFSESLWRTVWSMPPDLRRVITHIYLCGRSYEELAQLVNQSPDEIEIAHDQALAHLRTRIKETSAWQ